MFKKFITSVNYRENMYRLVQILIQVHSCLIGTFQGHDIKVFSLSFRSAGKGPFMASKVKICARGALFLGRGRGRGRGRGSNLKLHRRL